MSCSLNSALTVAVLSIPFRYFVPEDGDLESSPNVFLAPKPRQQGYPPTLAEVKHSFPLPGRYHFRFKSPLVPGTDRDKGAMAVWLDCVDDRQHVPTWKSSIVAKVTRIGVEDEEDDDDSDFVRGGSVPASTPAAPAPAARTQPTPSLDIFDGPSPTSSTSAPPSGAGSLLDGHGPTPTPAAAAATKDNLLDMNTPVYGGQQKHQQQQSSNAHADFLGMHATPSPPVSGGYPVQQAPNSYGRPQAPPQQQQQHRQQSQNNAFNSFSSTGQKGGPFGDLGTPWK